MSPTRRSLVAALPALTLAWPAAAAPSKDLTVRGRTIYSESSMVMSMTPDGRSAVTLRFCRFPEAGMTWLWCHVVRDGQLYAFTSHDLPCGPERLAGQPDAAYRAPPMIASLVRTGGGESLTSVRIEAALPFHRSRAAPHGPGRSAGRFSGVFTPTRRLAATVNAGRDEVYGLLRAEIEVGGRRLVHEAPAKFHEQRQEGPRFEGPFCYSWLAGGDAAATTLLTAAGAGGGWQFGAAEDALADMAIDSPAAARRADYRFKSGRHVAGDLAAVVRYQIPVYDRAWQGSFVRGRVDGQAVVGVVNDWTTAPDIYAAARARAGAL